MFCFPNLSYRILVENDPEEKEASGSVISKCYLSDEKNLSRFLAKTLEFILTLKIIGSLRKMQKNVWHCVELCEVKNHSMN